MKKVLLDLTDTLFAAIESQRKTEPRNAFIRRKLAKILGIKQEPVSPGPRKRAAETDE